MIRLCDFFLALLGLMVFSPLMLFVWLIIRCESPSPIVFQERVGRYKKSFVLIKFRTMKLTTELVATHLVDDAAVTPFGRFLRRTKIDELPQLWNVIRGDMSLVGPRPCLFSQNELIFERSSRGVYDVRPGITGLAQTKGIDMSTPELLADTDAEMLKNMNIFHYFRLLIITLLGKGSGDRVRVDLL